MKWGPYYIRRMLPGDLEQVMALEAEIFESPWTVDVFMQELGRRGAVYLVAEEEGILAGYAGANLVGDEIHLTNLAVRGRLRRRGLGTAMLLECVLRGIEERGARYVALEVRENNEAAREFYRGLGFRELGIRMGYYADTGEHAVAMATGDIHGGLGGVPLDELERTVRAKLEGEAC